MSNKPKQPAPTKPRQPRFIPAPTRQRHDGWTPERQTAFIEALAASACVDEACASVGMTTASAYRLRARFDAQSFRLAWEAALDYGIRRLGDAVIARALHGTPVPHYYKGEQVGEHRRYDNRLAQFLLRYRDPLRYAATLDQLVFSGDPEIAALRLARLTARVESGKEGFDADAPRGLPWDSRPVPSAAEQRAEAARERAESWYEEHAARQAETDAAIDEMCRELGIAPPRDDAERERDVPLAGATDPPPVASTAGEGGPRVTWR